MARKLTDQQQRRIQKRQQNLVTDNDGAIVIANFGQSVLLRDDAGGLFEATPRQNLGSLVAGDRVDWQLEQGDAVVCCRHERRSLLSRPDIYKQNKDIAANIDQMVIVAAVIPELVPYYIDKYTIAAALQGFDALVVVNKIDLANDSQQLDLAQHVEVYRQLGYSVIETSIHQSVLLARLKEQLAGKTSILVGQSGVGKSALLNAISGSELAEEGVISAINRKGKHTTTTARLYHLPDDIKIIDSPGIREFGLWDLSQQQILQGMREFDQVFGACKFRNCQHQNEPGCAIVQAHLDGKINPSRWQSYQRLLHHLSEG